MPPIQSIYATARPVTLAGVLRQVVQAFSAIGDSTPILVGRHYLQQSLGSAPHVVFCPESAGGSIGDPIEMGKACSMNHSCEVHVRAAEGQDDLARFDAAYALSDLVLSCLTAAGSGRISFGALSDGSPTDSNFVGAEVVFAFTFQRDIWHDASRWALPPADDTDDTYQQPHPPPGVPADGVNLSFPEDRS